MGTSRLFSLQHLGRSVARHGRYGCPCTMRLRGGGSDTEGTLRFARTQVSRCHLVHCQHATSTGTPSHGLDLAPAGMSFALYMYAALQALRTCTLARLRKPTLQGLHVSSKGSNLVTSVVWRQGKHWPVPYGSRLRSPLRANYSVVSKDRPPPKPSFPRSVRPGQARQGMGSAGSSISADLYLYLSLPLRMR
ncbi:hypothetical protein J3F83DRAFT_571252 [Trichoderma novae-zelandiae]